MAEPSPQALVRWAFRWALGLFILAACGGVLYRAILGFGLSPDQVAGIELGNLRHAHSHLMYFGWATPALMALMAYAITQATGHLPRGVKGVLASVFGCALFAFVLFLVYGYQPALIGGRRLPLSVIAAGLNVLTWYAFAAYYVRATHTVKRTPAFELFDRAVLFMLMATLGAWGLPLMKPFGLDDPVLSTALTHVFLDLFSEGWFVLGVLGLVCSQLAPERPLPRAALHAVTLGIPFTFALAMPAGYVPPVWKGLAAGAGLCVGLGLMGLALHLWRYTSARHWVWRVALGCLLLKAGGQVVVALVPHIHWAALFGLRILYLHLMLLGFVSLGLVAVAQGSGLTLGRGLPWMAATVLVLLLSLIPLTSWWPTFWSGRWVFTAATLAAAGPVGAALAMLLSLRASARPIA